MKELLRNKETNRFLLLLIVFYLLVLVESVSDSQIYLTQAEAEYLTPSQLLMSDHPGDEYRFSNREEATTNFERVAAPEAFENALLCLEFVDHTDCLNFSIPQDSIGFQPNWEMIENFLSQASLNSDRPLSIFWIHNHPQFLQDTYHLQVTAPPSDKDYTFHHQLEEVSQQYFPELALEAIVVGTEGRWSFAIDNQEYQIDSWSRQNLEHLGIDEDQDWSSLNPEVVANQIEEMQDYLISLGIDLEFDQNEALVTDCRLDNC